MYKSQLQVLCQKNSWGLPEYTVVKDGPDHNPKFSATVIVNGFPFQTTEDSRNAKEAQNKVAQLAFYGLSHPIPSPNTTPPSGYPAVPGTAVQPPSGFPSFEMELDRQLVGGAHQPTMMEVSPTQQPSLAVKNDVKAIDARHLYKNRLQSFAQKKNLKMPEYACQHEGPTNARRFRCNVTVDGKAYGGSEFYYTVKEAEHAAAKLAWDSLAADETQQGDCGLYKNLLQELAQKRGLHIPEYEAIISGPPHMPTFLSIVKVGGQSFQGEAAKSKKQAEMIAAKVAYYGLINGVENSDGEKTVSNEARVARQPGSENASLPVFPSGSAIAKALDQSTTVMQFVATTSPNQNGERNTGGNEYSSQAAASLNNGDVGSKRQRFSPPNEAACVPDVDQGAGGVRYYDKIFVVPRVPNMTFPEGADFFPFSDDKWVAYKIKQAQS